MSGFIICVVFFIMIIFTPMLDFLLRIIVPILPYSNVFFQSIRYIFSSNMFQLTSGTINASIFMILIFVQEHFKLNIIKGAKYFTN